ncbi:radical SAM protein [bacterium]|jgi:anaerobic magnesium-protoporphyrin IX monomethyl ester cyclase|nr:radical SAM protein [bacterium]
MTKIVLCVCPSWGPELPPLNLALLKAANEKIGYSTLCLDLNLDAYLVQSHKTLWNKHGLRNWTDPGNFESKVLAHYSEYLDRWSDELANHPAPYLGFCVLDSNVLFTNELVRRIKLRSKKVILAGGPEVYNKHTRVKLDQSFDYFLCGEGEEALGEWISWLDHGQNGPTPEGIHRVSSGLFLDVPFRSLRNLSTQPLPDWSDFALEKYEEKALPILGSRSCIFRCKFCTDYKSMGAFRALSSERLFESLKQAVDLGYKKVWFNDLLINGILRQLREAFEMLGKIGKSLEWIALATPNKQLKDEDLVFFKQQGLTTLNLGLESGSDHVMKLMKKGFNRIQASDGLKRIRAAGIDTQINVIVGYPGESEAHFQETLDFLDQHYPLISGFTSVNTCIMLPDSDIYEEREKLGAELPEDKDPTKWFLGKENTPEIRQDRLERLMDWIKVRGYPIYSSNR